MDIAFCINRLGLAGLGGTMTSLIRNCSDTRRLKIWIFCVDFTNREKMSIVKLFESEQYHGDYDFIDFEPVNIFGSFSSLHGDWTTYGRLLLTDYLDSDQVLYLDNDLLVELDVLEVADFDFQGMSLAAVGGGKFKYALGSKFYIGKLGLSPDLEYFNAGVLLFNLREWRSKRLKEKSLDIARQYPSELPSHDQSIMNLICKGNFAKLPLSFNCEWYADKPKPLIAERMILHFIGAPKPWDPLGYFLHNGYREWRTYSEEGWNANFGRLTSESLIRAWHIRRSYLRCIRNRVFQ
jgi:lipopolysaccharide biosynthesis glycosyltransferase